MRILLFDNFDSFSYNLVDLLRQESEEVVVVRNDVWQPGLDEVDAVVFSPGPCTPAENGRLMEAVAYYCPRLPVLGVCLGHQAIGLFYGAQLIAAPEPVHGKTAALRWVNPSTLFAGIAENESFMRYHSLMLQDLPAILRPTAVTETGIIMAFEHAELPVYGVQFHPESILSPGGKRVIHNFVQRAKAARRNNNSIS